jgi:cation:H+ antiporter
MLMQVLMFVLGLVALVIGAEAMVRGASRLAVSWGISPLVVGLTVVAFGTSAPEMAVSVSAALSGTTDLAIGNVVGSNIANVLLILGISALVAPLLVDEQIIRQEIPIMIGASLVVVAMALDGHIGRIEAGLLFALVVAYTVFLVLQSRRASQATEDEFSSEIPTSQWDRHWGVQAALVMGGLALLVLGADWLVGAAVTFAKVMGVSDLVIGLTVVAVGTWRSRASICCISCWRRSSTTACRRIPASC